MLKKIESLCFCCLLNAFLLMMGGELRYSELLLKICQGKKSLYSAFF